MDHIKELLRELLKDNLEICIDYYSGAETIVVEVYFDGDLMDSAEVEVGKFC